MQQIVKPIFMLSVLTMISCNTMQNTTNQNQQTLIHRTVYPGFEHIKTEFLRNFKERGEIGASCSGYKHQIQQAKFQLIEFLFYKNIVSIQV
jgi:hypothetical protein